MTVKNWTDMTPLEKREERFRRWLEPEGVKFVDGAAANAYRQRAQRLIDAYNVREPDRVPVSLPVGSSPAYAYGTDYRTCMYDYEIAVRAWDSFNQDFADADTLATPAMVLPGRVYDLMDYRLYRWPGHGLAENAQGIQFNEGEYMKADEYDALIKNPSDFWMRVYMPRIFGAFESWKHLGSFTSIIELPSMYFMPFMRPDVQDSMRRLIEIGNELSRQMSVLGPYMRKMLEAGYPQARGMLAKAPFDTIGDTLRGTEGIISDMFRRPEKLLEAIDVVTHLTIDSVISTVNTSGGLMAMFPLHKGADGWMSAGQFDRFYWPSLKEVVDALVNEGIMVTLFAEGSYNSRLDSVNVFPRGAVSWLFDRTDMAQAKKVLGKDCCISGNVPTSLLMTGTPQAVKDYCHNLIEICAPGGGYILAGGAQVDRGNPANFRAMLDAAREYGQYK